MRPRPHPCSGRGKRNSISLRLGQTEDRVDGLDDVLLVSEVPIPVRVRQTLYSSRVVRDTLPGQVPRDHRVLVRGVEVKLRRVLFLDLGAASAVDVGVGQPFLDIARPLADRPDLRMDWLALLPIEKVHRDTVIHLGEDFSIVLDADVDLAALEERLHMTGEIADLQRHRVSHRLIPVLEILLAGSIDGTGVDEEDHLQGVRGDIRPALVGVAVVPEGSEAGRWFARVSTVAVTKLAEEIAYAMPGLVGEVPEINAIGHVRPDFCNRHEEAALGRARFRRSEQLGLVPVRDVERRVVHAAGDELREPGRRAGVLNGALEVFLELVEEELALDLQPETAPAGDTQCSPIRIEGLVCKDDGRAVLGLRLPAVASG